MEKNYSVSFENFDAENFIRVFVDIFYDHQVTVKEILKKGSEVSDNTSSYQPAAG